MTRKFALRAFLVATPLVVFIVYAALNWFRFEEEKVWVGASEAARGDPYLAYKRLLGRMGAGAESTDRPSRLDVLAGGTVLIGAHRLIYMSPDRARRIQDWVNAGGMLIVEAEPIGVDDPLLAAFGIDRTYLPPNPGQGPPRVPGAPRPRPPPATTAFKWPGGEAALTVQFGNPWLHLADRRGRANAVMANHEGRSVALAIDVGKGQVIALSSFSFLRNNQIGRLDHAEFGWRIAAAHGPAPVLIFLRTGRASLSDWLLREAWTVMIAGAALVVLWLAHAVPRFGPLQPEAPPVRRSLVEHIRSSGRYLWSRAQGEYLLAAARERVARSVARRGGKIAIPTVGSAATADRFVTACTALQHIESNLKINKDRRA